MTTEQKIILRVVKAAAAIPNTMNYDEYIAQSPEYKEWAEAVQEMMVYAEASLNEGSVYSNVKAV